jgi:hypothetical protein
MSGRTTPHPLRPRAFPTEPGPPPVGWPSAVAQRPQGPQATRHCRAGPDRPWAPTQPPHPTTTTTTTTATTTIRTGYSVGAPQEALSRDCWCATLLWFQQAAEFRESLQTLDPLLGTRGRPRHATVCIFQNTFFQGGRQGGPHDRPRFSGSLRHLDSSGLPRCRSEVVVTEHRLQEYCCGAACRSPKGTSRLAHSRVRAR